MENGLLEEEDADYQEPEHPDKGLAINVELFDELAAVGEEAEDTVEEEIVEEEIVEEVPRQKKFRLKKSLLKASTKKSSRRLNLKSRKPM